MIVDPLRSLRRFIGCYVPCWGCRFLKGQGLHLSRFQSFRTVYCKIVRPNSRKFFRVEFTELLLLTKIQLTGPDMVRRWGLRYQSTSVRPSKEPPLNSLRRVFFLPPSHSCLLSVGYVVRSLYRPTVFLIKTKVVKDEVGKFSVDIKYHHLLLTQRDPRTTSSEVTYTVRT